MREAGVMLIVKDGLILGVSRKHDPSKFGLPGGKVNEYESPVMGAVRETLEETGVLVHECKIIYQREEPPELAGGLPFFTYCFLALDWQNEPQALEGGSVKWFTAKEFTSSECTGGFSKYIIDILDNLKQKCPNVHIQGEY